MQPESQISLQMNDRSLRLCGFKADAYFRNIAGQQLEDPVLKLAGLMLGRDSVVFDIGANIGVTSLFFSTLCPDGRVYAFEPASRSFACLSKTMEVNGLTNVVVENKAVCDGASDEITFLEVDQFLAGSFAVPGEDSLAARNHSENLTRVPAITIDDYVSSHGISTLDLMKIDVEGFEISVLNGAAAAINRLKPDVILEFNPYCLITHSETLPGKALEIIRTIFPFVYQVADREVRLIDSAQDQHDFLHDSITCKQLYNLYCTFRKKENLAAEFRNLLPKPGSEPPLENCAATPFEMKYLIRPFRKVKRLIRGR